MKRFAIAVSALLLLGVFSLYNQHHYQKVTEELRHQLAESVALTRSGDVDEAKIEMERLKNDAEGHKHYFNMTTNHSELDMMFETLDRCLGALREGELNNYFIEAHLLDQQIHHIYETECVTLQNVF